MSTTTYGFYPGCTYQTAAGYKESVDAVIKHLGIEFTPISNWECCGATAVFGVDETKALTLCARVFVQATEDGFDQIVTGCNACYTTLRKAAKYLSESSGKRLAPKTIPKIRHILEVFANDIPKERWSQNKNRSLSDIRVAGYYGCQLTRPWTDVDDPQRPTILERFIANLGFTAVDHSAKTICCGASHNVAYEKECQNLIGRIINTIYEKQAATIATICPLCQLNLDTAQKKNLPKPNLPVLYFSQLAGIALGIDPEKLGLDKLLVPVKGALRQVIS